MKKTLPFFLILSCCFIATAYNDHRGHNLDSLEHVAARWTQDMVDAASDEDAADVLRCWDNLMNGYQQINAVKSQYYAHKVLDLATARGWDKSIVFSSKMLGQHMWAQDKYDSAAYWYNNALAAVQRMADGSTTFIDTDGYDESDIDDALSSLYGSLGNLYCMMDSIPQAMHYYGKAGEIFEKYGWLESLAVLNYNMGELYKDECEYKLSEEHYLKALEYGREADDSLWISMPLKGLASVFIAKGKPMKAMKYLLESDTYFSENEDQEFVSRLEVLGMMNMVFVAQKRRLVITIVVVCIAFLFMLMLLMAMLMVRKLRKEKKETAVILEETIEELPKASRGEDMKLTDRELQILHLIAEGKTNPQIAEQIFLSPETIKWYRKKLLVKFEAANSAELIGKAQSYLK